MLEKARRDSRARAQLGTGVARRAADVVPEGLRHGLGVREGLGGDVAGEGGLARSGASAGEDAYLPSSSSSVVGGAPPPPPPPFVDEAGRDEEDEDDPVLLAAAAAPQAAEAHQVCSVGQLSWCSSCRWARPSGSRAPWPAACNMEEVKSEFAGDSARIQLVHPVVFVRGLALCLRCGAFSTKRLFRLSTTACTPTAAGRRELRRVFGGRLPTKVRGWPLDSPGAG